MKKYEYKTLQDTITFAFTLEDLNKLGQEGWRVVGYQITNLGYEMCLLEREIEVISS